MSDRQSEPEETGGPSVGGTDTPIAGSKDGLGEKDPVVSEVAEDARQQSA
jgi:hypothetical protein